ncbi:MAG: hypothetical protein ABII16_03560 [Patescibacteria group bacterium]
MTLVTAFKKTHKILLFAFIILISVVGFSFAQSGTYPWDSNVNPSDIWQEGMDPASGLNQYKWGREMLNIPLTALNNAFNGDSSSAAIAVLPASVIGFMYENPPTGNFDQYMASLGVVKPTYAAGTEVLRVILNIWRMFRNFAYIAMTIALLIIGLMIMFKKKLDPRTVVTVSNSLPNIVVALLLITFSYAIGGLMFDASKLFVSVTYNLLNISLQPDIAGAPAKIQVKNKDKPPKLIDVDTWYCPANGVGKETTPGVFPCPFKVPDIIGVFGSQFLVSDALSGTMGSWNMGSIGPGILKVDLEASVLFSIAIGIALFSAAVKLMFTLLTAYVKFFLNTLIAPVLLLMSAMPGNSEQIGKWLKGYLSSVLVFGAVFGYLNIIYYLRIYGNFSGLGANIEVPNIIPIDTTNATSSMVNIIVYAMLLLTPAIPHVIDEALEVSPKGSAAREMPDISKTASKIPIVGGLFS